MIPISMAARICEETREHTVLCGADHRPKVADTVVQADMKLWPFQVLSSSGDKTRIRVQS